MVWKDPPDRVLIVLENPLRFFTRKFFENGLPINRQYDGTMEWLVGFRFA